MRACLSVVVTVHVSPSVKRSPHARAHTQTLTRIRIWGRCRAVVGNLRQLLRRIKKEKKQIDFFMFFFQIFSFIFCQFCSRTSNKNRNYFHSFQFTFKNVTTKCLDLRLFCYILNEYRLLGVCPCLCSLSYTRYFGIQLSDWMFTWEFLFSSVFVLAELLLISYHFIFSSF